MSLSNYPDVVVVGAGLSGLRAAVELHRFGLSVVVLEATDRIGGKTLSVEALTGTKGKIDLGATWINDTSQTEMYTLARAFGFDLVKQYASGAYLREKKDGTVLPYSLGFGAETHEPDVLRLYEMLNRLADTWLGPDRKALDSVTLQALAEANCSDKTLAREAADFLSEQFLGINANEISALFVIELIKSAGGLEAMLSSTWNGAQYLRVRQGAQSFATCLGSLLPEGTIHLASAVTGITQRASSCYVETASGGIFRCKRVVASIPTTQYRTITFSPDLPRPVSTPAAETMNGYHVRIVLVFETPWWREAGLSGSIESTCTSGPISFTCDTSIEEDRHYSLTCFIVGESGRQWSALPASERQAQIWKHLAKVFSTRVDMTLIPQPVDTVEKEWPQGTIPVMPPGVLDSKAGEALGKPFGHVHFVGTETADVWRGYMEGAVRSGLRGAREVVVALADSTGTETAEAPAMRSLL